MAFKSISQDADVHSNAPLRPWTYGLLAVIACIIGLASSTITAKFFIIGLERMEADNEAR